MDISEDLLICIHDFLLKHKFVKTAKIFAKEIDKMEFFLKEKEEISLIEMYKYYIENIGSKESINVEKNNQVSIIEKSEKKKKKKSIKDTQTEKEMKVKKRKKKDSDQEISIKSKKYKEETEKNVENKDQDRQLDGISVNDTLDISNGVENTQSNDKAETSNLNFEINNKKNSEKSINTEKEQKKNPSFSRIDKSKIEFAHESLKDNSYFGTYQEEWNEYGRKANMDLIVTRGKEFRAKKSKKKRGSYHGGKIDSNVSRSFKFT
ncbi:hypothetical protein T552_03249 [Pneumocystis carinii B80]|uniref:Srp40 C-terminal domain-containing protein n=1 Tax=Pneumocystis carinii (strain B80) TaxID=1408658 RepID=A0A0W4ZCB2_PNEC8|nr:hypothetical protein T552_03249 [Pneumocystis carinii B80]KTW25975.1 hypothetical protein T552_03249 [Pneumocystis carinii B80]